MKKVKQYKGFIIALDAEKRYQIFFKEEWIMGKGFRYADHDACSLNEAIEWIDCY
jgi:hypothetical protein